MEGLPQPADKGAEVTRRHFSELVCAESGRALIEGASSRVCVAPCAQTAISQSCRILFDREAAVKALTANDFAPQHTAGAFSLSWSRPLYSLSPSPSLGRLPGAGVAAMKSALSTSA